MLIAGKKALKKAPDQHKAPLFPAAGRPSAVEPGRASRAATRMINKGLMVQNANRGDAGRWPRGRNGGGAKLEPGWKGQLAGESGLSS